MRQLKTVAFLLLAVSVASAQESTTQPASRPATDQSTPVATLLSFTRAILNAQPEAVRQTLLASTDLQQRYAAGYVDVTVGLARLKNAIRDRFGTQAANIMLGTDEEQLERIEKQAKVNIDEDTARIELPGENKVSLVMVRTEGVWKISVADMMQDRGEQAIEKDLQTMQKMAAAANETADEISAGKFERVDQAMEAFKGRLPR